MRNQAYSQDQLKDDGQTGNNKRSVKAEEMIAVDVNLEAIHVDDLQDSRHDENEAQKDLQGRFAEGIDQTYCFGLKLLIRFSHQLGFSPVTSYSDTS